MTAQNSDHRPFSWCRVAVVTVIVLLSLAALAFGAIGIYNYETSPPDFEELTSHLPECERIQIDAIKGSETDVLAVEGSKTLTGLEEKSFADLWREQPFIDGPGDLCHSPIYRVQFYRHDILYAEATICFGCCNIYFIDHPTPTSNEVFREISFNPREEKIRNLRSYLSGLFPDRDPRFK